MYINYLTNYFTCISKVFINRSQLQKVLNLNFRKRKFELNLIRNLKTNLDVLENVNNLNPFEISSIFYIILI